MGATIISMQGQELPIQVEMKSDIMACSAPTRVLQAPMVAAGSFLTDRQPKKDCSSEVLTGPRIPHSAASPSCCAVKARQMGTRPALGPPSARFLWHCCFGPPLGSGQQKRGLELSFRNPEKQLLVLALMKAGTKVLSRCWFGTILAPLGPSCRSFFFNHPETSSDLS